MDLVVLLVKKPVVSKSVEAVSSHIALAFSTIGTIVTDSRKVLNHTTLG